MISVKKKKILEKSFLNINRKTLNLSEKYFVKMSLNAKSLIKFENENDLHNISRIIKCLNGQHLMWYIENSHMCTELAESIAKNLLNPYPKKV